MKRKWLSAALIGALLATSVPAFAADENAGEISLPFTDVAADAWYKDAVAYAYGEGLMTGTSATEFAPETTTTRGMIVSMLARLEGVESAEAAGFADVEGEWYATAVNWAANAGVVNGYEDNTFRPNAAITREQLAAILMNYAAYKGEDVSNRADLANYTDQPSAWAEEAMQWAVAEGLISGVTNDELQPQGQATRAQVAAILQRFLTDAEAPAGETITLVIGRGERTQKVTVPAGEVTPENVIAALAAETGWNLDLAAPVSVDAEGIATVVFAADSGVYGEPPEPQKDAYHVYDVEDWIFTVFNSVDASLRANGCSGTCFTAPDGGKLTIDNGGVQFYLMPTFVWSENAAERTNHQSTELIDHVVVSPVDESWPMGTDVLLLYLPVSDVTLTGGTYTIYDEAGNAIQQSSVVERAWVNTAMSEANADFVAKWGNFDALSVVSLELDEALAPGSYSVHVDAQSIQADDGRYMKEIGTDLWRFSVENYGTANSTLPDGVESVLDRGESYTLDVVLDGDTVDHAVVQCFDGYVSCDTETLSASGSIAFTAEKTTAGASTLLWQLDFYKGDTLVNSIAYDAQIV